MHVSGPKYGGFTLPSDYPAGEEDAFGRKDARSRSGLAFYPGGNRVQMASYRHSLIADYRVTETPLKKIYAYDSVLQLSGPHEKATKTGGNHRQHQISPKRLHDDASLAVAHRSYHAR